MAPHTNISQPALQGIQGSFCSHEKVCVQCSQREIAELEQRIRAIKAKMSQCDHNGMTNVPYYYASPNQVLYGTGLAGQTVTAGYMQPSDFQVSQGAVTTSASFYA